MRRRGRTTKAVLVSGVKGGVGKTTVAVELARRLAARVPPVAFLDCDLDNPSGARALGLPPEAEVRFTKDADYVPWTQDGIAVFSQSLVGKGVRALTWVGEQHRGLIADAVRHTRWPADARLMVVDLPAGSGDELLAAVQTIGAGSCAMVLVTIPRHLDATERAVQIAKDLEVRTIGVVQNLSSFECTNCGAEHRPFGRGRAEAFCSNYGIRFLGDVPVSQRVSDAMEAGLAIPEDLASPVIRAAAEVLSLGGLLPEEDV